MIPYTVEHEGIYYATYEYQGQCMKVRGLKTSIQNNSRFTESSEREGGGKMNQTFRFRFAFNIVYFAILQKN